MIRKVIINENDELELKSYRRRKSNKRQNIVEKP